MTPMQWLQAFVIFNAEHIDQEGRFRQGRPRLSPTSAKVAVWLASQADPATMIVTNQRQQRIAAVIGQGQPVVSTAIRKMQQTGWLERLKRGQGTAGTAVYRLTTPDMFWDEYIGALISKSANSPAWSADVGPELRGWVRSECPIAGRETSQAAPAERGSRTVGERLSSGVPA